MIFPFVRYRVDASPAIPSGFVARPEVPIRIATLGGEIEASGLIDTGADQVFAPLFIAEALGITLDSAAAEGAIGAGGHVLRTWPAGVELELVDGDGKAQCWSTTIGFMDSDDDLAPLLLGHAGFLEFFTAIFDGDLQTVELTPNAKLLRL
jgi:hypothetical protein